MVLNMVMFPMHPGTLPDIVSRNQDTSMISMSTSLSSISTDNSNELFKFVKSMREKFQATVAHGMTLCFGF